MGLAHPSMTGEKSLRGLRRAPFADELGKPPNCFQDTFGRPLLLRYGIWVAGNGNTVCGFRDFEDGKFSVWPRWSLSLGSFSLGDILDRNNVWDSILWSPSLKCGYVYTL